MLNVIFYSARNYFYQKKMESQEKISFKFIKLERKVQFYFNFNRNFPLILHYAIENISKNYYMKKKKA